MHRVRVILGVSLWCVERRCLVRSHCCEKQRPYNIDGMYPRLECTNVHTQVFVCGQVVSMCTRCRCRQVQAEGVQISEKSVPEQGHEGPGEIRGHGGRLGSENGKERRACARGRLCVMVLIHRGVNPQCCYQYCVVVINHRSINFSIAAENAAKPAQPMHMALGPPLYARMAPVAHPADAAL